MELAKILLVEDNPSAILLTKHAFKSSKLINNFMVAEDGEKALQILFKEGDYTDAPTPDLVLLDLNIPKIEGREVLKTIKESDKLKRIPVVIMSGSKAERDIVETYDLHANCYIIKPLDLQKLSEVAQKIDDFWFSLVKLPPHKNED